MEFRLFDNELSQNTLHLRDYASVLKMPAA